MEHAIAANRKLRLLSVISRKTKDGTLIYPTSNNQVSCISISLGKICQNIVDTLTKDVGSTKELGSSLSCFKIGMKFLSSQRGAFQKPLIIPKNLSLQWRESVHVP